MNDWEFRNGSSVSMILRKTIVVFVQAKVNIALLTEYLRLQVASFKLTSSTMFGIMRKVLKPIVPYALVGARFS